MKRVSITFKTVALALLATGCATSSSSSNTSTLSAADMPRGPVAGKAKVYALAPPPPSDLAQGSGMALGWSGSKSKKKSKDPLPSYAEAMLKPADLGDLTHEGGEEHLSSSTVADVMNGHVNDIFDGCVLKEIRKTKLNRIAIQMVISGKGRIAGATTKPGSKNFQRCVARKLLRIDFPEFSAPRMGAEYAFRVE